MFGFRPATPPLTTYQRFDLELLMRRTVESVGLENVRDTEIVTDLRQLKLDHSGPEPLLRSAADEVRSRLAIVGDDVRLKIVENDKLDHPSRYKAADGESSAVITVAEDTVTKPLQTVIELAYQFSHHRWLTLPDNRPLDLHPRTTHLLPICCGLGVLASDASLVDKQWSQAGWAGWSITRSGYYNAVEIGYALALLARARNENSPHWSRVLRPDSGVTAKKAWRYFDRLQHSGGSLLFDAATIPGSDRDPIELSHWLAGEDPCFALAAGFALCKFDELPPVAIQAAIRATHQGDPDVVPVAVRLLAGARNETPDAIDRVTELIGERDVATATAALQAAAALGVDLTPHTKTISKLLDACADNPIALLKVIAEHGERFGSLDSQVADHIALALRYEDSGLVDALIECLTEICESPEALIRKRVRNRQHQQAALLALAECANSTDAAAAALPASNA